MGVVFSVYVLMLWYAGLREDARAAAVEKKGKKSGLTEEELEKLEERKVGAGGGEECAVCLEEMVEGQGFDVTLLEAGSGPAEEVGVRGQFSEDVKMLMDFGILIEIYFRWLMSLASSHLPSGPDQHITPQEAWSPKPQINACIKPVDALIYANMLMIEDLNTCEDQFLPVAPYWFSLTRDMPSYWCYASTKRMLHTNMDMAL
ncbi:hypothetical protein COCNU_07G015170 [Cocos nucifera]|uniref:Uncharacterized protein n=1 Tax=Cocos nucifera TaxID=13894 RepID=A0A8K0IG94_COCNU|nr:hypothetical protein COCNU_07G015170 [Cocos nucifera]